MKVIGILAGIILLIGIGCSPQTNNFNKNSMRITSPNFNENDYLTVAFTCDGEGINPQLNFEKVPENAKSLVLIMDDPDAPMGTFVHWTMWNINPKVEKIPERYTTPPEVEEGKNSAGNRGYVPPCPPSGTHRYYFKLYALDTMLDLNRESTVDKLKDVMKGHILDQAELMGKYQRSN